MSAMQMSNSSHHEGFHPNTRMLAAGAAMTGVGAMITAAGAALVGLSLAMAGRRWVHSWEIPPAEVAHRTLAQARMASQAGLEAWRNGQPMN